MMRRLGLILTAGFLIISADAVSAAPESRPFLLVSIAQLGTVTWRCDNRDRTRQALAFTAFVRGATERVRFTAVGARQKPRVVQPGQVLHFPALRNRVQQLDILQGTKVALLHAVVTVHFLAGRDYCFSYWPPTTEVRFTRS
jgi:hypothetical protein